MVRNYHVAQNLHLQVRSFHIEALDIFCIMKNLHKIVAYRIKYKCISFVVSLQNRYYLKYIKYVLCKYVCIVFPRQFAIDCTEYCSRSQTLNYCTNIINSTQIVSFLNQSYICKAYLVQGINVLLQRSSVMYHNPGPLNCLWSF